MIEKYMAFNGIGLTGQVRLKLDYMLRNWTRACSELKPLLAVFVNNYKSSFASLSFINVPFSSERSV